MASFLTQADYQVTWTRPLWTRYSYADDIREDFRRAVEKDRLVQQRIHRARFSMAVTTTAHPEPRLPIVPRRRVQSRPRDARHLSRERRTGHV